MPERKFGGALIAYSNIKLLRDNGRVIDDAPFIHFKIQADFVLFRPSVGSCLRGVVNKVGKDHIGLLVHDHFNVSVPLLQNGHREEVTVVKGDSCTFTVSHLYMHRNLLSMRGKHVQR
ncbi:DNA-directed RNA polymerase I subunit RPA43-like [Littorina saxatilis]|uniref:DNA-directed RNA polymerase I subunit RPA43-like n=1 Tax=Littorina saxatilis TaxID=31220 RepID=UPI0038B55A9C